MRFKKTIAILSLFSLALLQSGLTHKTAAAAEYTAAEVAAHTAASNCWVIVQDKVYDITPIMSWHANVITCGADNTNAYLAKHSTLNNIAPYEIGTLVVPPANQAPQLDFIPEIVALEGSLVKIDATATDPDNDSLTFSFSSPFNSSGEWLTTLGDAGDYTIAVTVSDGALSDSQDVIVTILPDTTSGNTDNGNTDNNNSASSTNQAPVLSAIDNITVTEGELVKINPHASDPDGDTLSFTFSAPLNANGEWQTAVGDAGTQAATVTVSDGELTDSVNFNIFVQSVESLPTYSSADLVSHDSESDCWVAVFDQVYDITPIMADYAYFFTCGADNSSAWENSMFGTDTTLLEPYIVGTLDASTNNETDDSTSVDDDDEDEDEDKNEDNDKDGQWLEIRHEWLEKLTEKTQERLKKAQERIEETASRRLESRTRSSSHETEENDDD